MSLDLWVFIKNGSTPFGMGFGHKCRNDSENK